jgi:hypothetical protein
MKCLAQSIKNQQTNCLTTWQDVDTCTNSHFIPSIPLVWLRHHSCLATYICIKATIKETLGWWFFVERVFRSWISVFKNDKIKKLQCPGCHEYDVISYLPPHSIQLMGRKTSRHKNKSIFVYSRKMWFKLWTRKLCIRKYSLVKSKFFFSIHIPDIQLDYAIEDLHVRRSPPYWRYFLGAARAVLMEITLENGRK